MEINESIQNVIPRAVARGRFFAKITEDDLRDGAIDILSVLVKAELVPSRSEARRAVEQGGVTVDGDKVTNIKTLYTKEQLANGLVIRRGKKAFKKIIF